MAEIKIEYRKGYCDLNSDNYCEQCQTMWAKDVGCPMFNDGGERLSENGRRVIPFGDCVHAKFDYLWKGLSVKNYDIHEHKDDYNLHLNCMIVETRYDYYECEKVELDGVVIYDNTNEE